MFGLARGLQELLHPGGTPASALEKLDHIIADSKPGLGTAIKCARCNTSSGIELYVVSGPRAQPP